MKIIGTGSVIPEKVVTNDMLSEFLDTSDAWIFPRTGIRSRRVISTEYLDEMAVEGARKAMEDAGLPPTELDLIICSNVVNEYATPSLSCIIQGGIGAKCGCIDINCACAGFIYAMDIAECYYKAGKAEHILVVCAEEPSRMCDWTDRNASVLFGDGVGAAVFGPGDNIKGVKVSAQSDTSKLYEKRILEPTPFINKAEENVPLLMKGQDVFKFAVRAASSDINYLLGKLGMTADQVDWFMLHQANKRIINAIRDYMEQPDGKFPSNIETHGNVSSAGCPILLDECRRKGMFKTGDILAFSAFGAGLISAAAIMEW